MPVSDVIFIRIQCRLTSGQISISPIDDSRFWFVCGREAQHEKAKHAKPPVDEHGLCVAYLARVLVVGGCGASKTTTILNCIARGAMWKPWDGGIYLIAPTKDVQQGEYGLVDTEYLDQLPQLEYFKQRPGRACLIMDDISATSDTEAEADACGGGGEARARAAAACYQRG
eukprot:COSAG02_NODE_14538_length_1261_cov_1.314114_1_plen_171_part_00